MEASSMRLRGCGPRCCCGLRFRPSRSNTAERLHVHETAVYASNHLSYYDTPVLFAKLPFQFRILAKAPLWKIPFIGWYLNRSGQVPIDQTSARSAVASLGRGVKTLQSGMPLVIFPRRRTRLQRQVAGHGFGRCVDGHQGAGASGSAYTGRHL